MYTHTFLSNLQLLHCILMLKDLGTEIKYRLLPVSPCCQSGKNSKNLMNYLLCETPSRFLGNLSPCEN